MDFMPFSHAVCYPCFQQDCSPLPFTPPSLPRNERGRNDGYKRPYVVIASAKHASPAEDKAAAITEITIKASCASSRACACTLQILARTNH